MRAVDKDADGTVTNEEPWFTNFQYDGRVDWGLGEGMIAEGFGVFQQMANTVLGSAYPADGLSLREAIIMDLRVKGGALTRAQAANLTRAEITAIMARSLNDPSIGQFMAEYEQRMAAEGQVSVGSRRRAEDNADEVAIEATESAGDMERVRIDAGESAPSEGWQYKLLDWYRRGGGLGVRGEASGSEGGRGSHRRRLSNHDEWGGVLLSLRLGRFANVYTQGHKMSIFDVIAAIGGASGSLIGLIGIGIATVEIFNTLTGGRNKETYKEGKTSKVDIDPGA